MLKIELVLLIILNVFFCNVVGEIFANKLVDETNIGENDVSHAFVQTGSELLYFRDISHQDIRLSINNGVERYYFKNLKLLF